MYQMFRAQICAFRERTEALLRTDPKMRRVAIDEEDDNIRFQFRFSHNITLSIRVAVVDYASSHVQGGLREELTGAVQQEFEDDEPFGERGTFVITLEEDGGDSPSVVSFHVADSWIEFYDVPEWERSFDIVNTLDQKLAQAIKTWFEVKQRDADAQRQQRLNRRTLDPRQDGIKD